MVGHRIIMATRIVIVHQIEMEDWTNKLRCGNLTASVGKNLFLEIAKTWQESKVFSVQ